MAPGGTWIKLMDTFPEHAKVAAAGPAAAWLYVCGLAYCSRLLTDGRIPKTVALFWEDAPAWQSIATLLAELEGQGDIEIRAEGRDLYSRSPVKILHLVSRQRFQRLKARRMIPLAIRRAVFERDGFSCVTCGSITSLSLDHIHPYSLGGLDTVENLQTLCRPCNSRKGARI